MVSYIFFDNIIRTKKRKNKHRFSARDQQSTVEQLAIHPYTHVRLDIHTQKLHFADLDPLTLYPT